MPTTLATYRRKRDFKKTPEPRGSAAKSTGDSFVIQKHAARRLHYDFRLELDGVLKSWAVTRGPSLVPGAKRLAVHVEDHPLDYGDFEGTIPKGEYGGGTVIVWDRGRWKPSGDPHKGLAKGHLDFELYGEKLAGRWHLVRMQGKARERNENWLLIKGDDEAARSASGPDILAEQPLSVKTGRDVAEVAGEAPGWSSKTGKIDPPPRPKLEPAKIKGAKRGALPAFVEPALAGLSATAPSGARWVHEIKFDGYRLEARIERGKVTLLTRTGLDWTAKFGKAIVGAFAALPVSSALIDGELVVENDRGASDFSALQAELSAKRDGRFVFYAFDLLHLDGYDLRAAGLVQRKALVEKLIGAGIGRLRYSAHFTGNGETVRAHACRLGLEGVVSKLRDGPYRSGRSKDWLKAKCGLRQELVVAGYVPSTTIHNAIGSLVLGYYGGRKLIHAGRVGTGFTAATAKDLWKRLEPIRTAASPFATRLTADEAKQVRYVKPQFVAEIEFGGWTADKMVRHASFRGLRDDKPAEEVTLETPSAPTRDPAKRRSAIKLTHPDRIYWPESGVTKQGLADYYAEIWDWMAPFVVARPLSLLRCPGGIADQCFFQKHAWQGMSRAIRATRDPTKTETILSIDDLDGIMGLVQGGVLEIHLWGAKLAALEWPDFIVLDLDPDERVGWAAVMDAAREVRERFKTQGLDSFVKTTGGKGLHVVAPLKPKAEWPEIKAFARDIATAMAADTPDRFIATAAKDKRHGKIFIDYLRNDRGSTAVAPYSTRARPGAAVSMPIAWDELRPPLGPAYFTVQNAPPRLAQLRADPWQEFWRAAAPLPAKRKSR